MPDRDELTSDPTPVTPKQHKWVRRVVGALSYYANTTRFDISYEVNRIAQYLQAPTLGTIKGISGWHCRQSIACGQGQYGRLVNIL